MINTVASLAVNSIVDSVPTLQEKSYQKANLKGFDTLLSNLLNGVTDSKELDDKTEIYLYEFYSGLFGALLTSSDGARHNVANARDELQTSDSRQMNNIAMKPLTEIQQLLNSIDELNNHNDNIDFEAYKRSIENILAKTQNITYCEVKQLSCAFENLIKSEAGFDKGVTDFNKPNFLQEMMEISSSIPNENSIIKLISGDAEKCYESAPEIFEKIRNGLNVKETPKQDVVIEQDNPDIRLKGLINEIDVKTITDRQSSNSSFDNLNEDNSFQLSESMDSDTQVKKTLETKKTFDFYVYQGNETASGDNVEAIIAKKDNLTQAIGDQIIKSAVFTNQNGKQEFELQLKPDFLGRIIIKLQNGEDGIKIRISTSNLGVKEILSAQFPQLQETLRAQGIGLQNAEVVYTGLANSKQDFTGDSRYRSNNKKSISQVKGEYEQAIISGIAEPIQGMRINYNGALNYLV